MVSRVLVEATPWRVRRSRQQVARERDKQLIRSLQERMHDSGMGIEELDDMVGHERSAWSKAARGG